MNGPSEDDQHSVEADGHRADHAEAVATHPFHIEAGAAEPQPRYEKHPADPPVHGNGSSPYLWNELHRPAEGYDRGK